MAQLAARWIKWAVFGLISYSASEASAFCRTTTCDAKGHNSIECELDLNGCATRGVPLYWPKRCVPLAVHEAGSAATGLSAQQFRSLLFDAAAQWTAPFCDTGEAPSIQFVDAGVVGCDRVEFNPRGPNANVVVFRDAEWTRGFGTYGMTTVTFRERTGEIVGVDIELNSATGEFTLGDDDVRVDLRSVLTHELGHALGLSHSPYLDATMYETYQYGTTHMRDLDWDDQQAVCTVYTPGRPIPPCDPARSFSERCGGNVVGSCAAAADPPQSHGGWWALGTFALGAWALGRRIARAA